MDKASALTNTAYLGLGGNIGDVLANMSNALTFLDGAEHIDVCDVSHVYKTPPWGITDQDWFLNCCAKIETSLDPQQLLKFCLETEQKLKRKRVLRWGPRSVDIDILVFGDLQISSEELTIPHPRMCERAFVMKPLGDIAPSLTINEKTTIEWMSLMDDADIEKVAVMKDWWRKSAD